jgi:hypothetical protein
VLIGAFLPAIQACCAFEASCAIARQAPRLNSAPVTTAANMGLVGENGWNTPRRLR